MRRAVLFCVLALIVVACGSGTARDQSAGCAEPLVEPGEYEGLNVVGDVEQPYWMVVPETYADVAPAPLYYLHLASGGGDHNTFLEGWRPHLDDLDGLMAIVNTANVARRSPETALALIDQISGDYCVDPTRIHVMGTSSSFQMADRIACEASDRIASFVAALGGAVWSDCEPERPVPLLTFSGDADRQGVNRLVEKWVVLNECDSDPTVENLGSGVTRKTYVNCDADIMFYDIEGMGHVWPMHEAKGPAVAFVAEYDEVDYLEAAFEFFSDHPLR